MGGRGVPTFLSSEVRMKNTDSKAGIGGRVVQESGAGTPIPKPESVAQGSDCRLDGDLHFAPLACGDHIGAVVVE
jgi:hypothetical protein